MLHLTFALTLLGSPEGFAPADRFDTIDEACEVLVEELSPDDYQSRVAAWCTRRSHGSSRNGKYRSRIDGSWVHDRDRPAAWKFYGWGKRIGRIDPETCEYDKVDRSIPHPRKSTKVAEDWPYVVPKMTERRRREWLGHPFDMERFGTRGPHDNNVTVARGVLPGCWAPEALDRNDVAATITVLRAVAICEEHGCPHASDIRAHW